MELNYKGCKIKIVQDDMPENPRVDWDNLGHMVCWHRHYELGDNHDFKEPIDFKNYTEDKENKVRFILPLFLYDHSGITMSTNNSAYPFNCRWDSGQVGWIFVTDYDIKKEFGVKRITKKVIEKARSILLNEVETYDCFIRGDVVGWIAEDKNGNVIDSCYGYFGLEESAKNGIIEEAKSSIDYYIKEKINEHIQKVKAWIKNNVSLDKRYALEI